MHDVNVRRRLEALNEGDTLGTRNPERARQKNHKLSKDVVCRDERLSLLPSLTIQGRGTIVIRLCWINKMPPPGGIHKDLRHPAALRALPRA